MKKALFFDLDGTLIDSVPDLALALNQTLQTLKKPTYSEKKIRQWVGNGALMLVKRALSGKEKPDMMSQEYVQKALELFLKNYQNHLCVHTTLYPGVQEILPHLAQKYTLAIITNKPYQFVLPILKRLHIDTHFQIVLGADSLPAKKPDPMPLLHLCKEFGIKKEEAFMIGDSKNDILAAKSAQIESIGVSWGYNYAEPIEIYEPTYVIRRFEELKEIV